MFWKNLSLKTEVGSLKITLSEAQKVTFCSQVKSQNDVTCGICNHYSQVPCKSCQGMFPLLNGEQKFTKVGLSQAYQQVELEQGSWYASSLTWIRTFSATAAHHLCTSDISIYSRTSMQDISGERLLFKCKWKNTLEKPGICAVMSNAIWKR